MAGTITPVVHGGRRTGWAISVALHAVGAGLAAAAFGALLGGGGALLGGPWGGAGLATIAVVALAYALRELGLPLPVPELRGQVPEWWRSQLGPHAAAFAYGLGLGIGFLTYLRHGTLVAVSALAVASGDPAIGALMLAPFGLARALSLTAVARARTSGEVHAVVDRLERIATSSWPRAANAAALGALAAAAAVAAPGARPLDASAVGSVAAAVVAGAFAWAAGAKVVGWAAWREALPAYRLGPLERPAALGVPVAEALVVLLVVMGVAAVAGALALVLLAAASVALVRARDGGDAPCACFGRRKVRSLRVLLTRNAALAALSGLALLAGNAPMRLPEADPLPLALVLLGVATAIALAAAARWLREGAGAASPKGPAPSRGTRARTGSR